MRTLAGLIETTVYTTDGYVAIEQPRLGGEICICLISVDQLPDVIRELEALYEQRRMWAEVRPE
jgi:hypothetical protein